MTSAGQNRDGAAASARAIRTPRTDDLPPALAAAARGIAERLARAGHRGWVVGGAVRDLALGLAPSDVDMASAARPEEIEGLFERTLAVGKAFGTVVVLWPAAGGEGPDVEVQLTTFRSESGYSDGRRPDRVEYGATPEEDAARRDFTCNALFLDPATEEVLDPTGGLADLAAGVLRCVGDARERFAEDGLRLLRMARFAAGFGLEPAPSVLAAAREERASLRGVSAERVYAELAATFRRPRAARALALLGACGLAAAVAPGLAEAGEEELAERARALDALPQPVGTEAGLAVLFEPRPVAQEDGDEALDAAGQALADLRAPVAVQRAVRRAWSLRRELERLDAASTRAERTLALRDEGFELALHLALAWRAARSAPSDDLQSLALARARATHEELFPEPLVTSADLAATGLERGPRWGELLRAAERAQLDGAFADRAGALRWLAERV